LENKIRVVAIRDETERKKKAYSLHAIWFKIEGRKEGRKEGDKC
jgi:hypothetical protein